MKNKLDSLLQRALTEFAAAAVYGAVEELTPEMSEGKRSNMGTVLLSVGFTS